MMPILGLLTRTSSAKPLFLVPIVSLGYLLMYGLKTAPPPLSNQSTFKELPTYQLNSTLVILNKGPTGRLRLCKASRHSVKSPDSAIGTMRGFPQTFWCAVFGE